MQETAVLQHRRESEWENATFVTNIANQFLGAVWSYMFRVRGWIQAQQERVCGRIMVGKRRDTTNIWYLVSLEYNITGPLYSFKDRITQKLTYLSCTQ